jgi:hypothetical protein
MNYPCLGKTFTKIRETPIIIPIKKAIKKMSIVAGVVKVIM